MIEKLFYENGPGYFGVNFPLGINAKKLAIKLEATNKKINTEIGKTSVLPIGSLKGNRTPI